MGVYQVQSEGFVPGTFLEMVELKIKHGKLKILVQKLKIKKRKSKINVQKLKISRCPATILQQLIPTSGRFLAYTTLILLKKLNS
jgi:hypothetical protein